MPDNGLGKLPKKIRDAIPKHPDGTPMLRLTPRGTLVRVPYQGKLRALPRDYKVPTAYQANSPEKTKRNTPKCNAPKDGKSSSGEGLCMQDAGWGTAHKGYGPCKLHGGCLPSITKKYLAKMERTAMKTYGEPIEIDPHAAVLGVVQATAGHVAWLQQKIEMLSETEGDMTLHQYTAMGIKASVWVEMYERERLLLLKAAKSAVDMGVNERQVQLAEEQGKIIAMVFQGFLDSQEISLTPTQRAAAPRVIRTLLSALPQQAAPGQAVRPLPDEGPATLTPAAEEEDEWEEF